MKRLGLTPILLACVGACSGAPADGDPSVPDAQTPIDAGVTEPEASDAGRPDAGPAPSLSPGDYERRLNTLDGERRYLIHVPDGLAAVAPVVLSLHGGGGSAEGQRDQTNMSAFADQEKFIVVYPEGIPADDMGDGSNPTATWNAGSCCGRAAEENIDDVGFISALLDDLASVHTYDTSRVYSTGFSNGASMTYRLGCELADRLAAIAPVGVSPDAYECENRTRKIPTMHIHGTADRCANYDGGPMCGGCFQRFINAAFNQMLPVPTSPCNPVTDGIGALRSEYQCEATSTVDYDQGAAHCETWRCADASEIRFCPVMGMGHAWPGGQAPSFCANPNSRICLAWIDEAGQSNDDIGFEQIWAFLSRFSL